MLFISLILLFLRDILPRSISCIVYIYWHIPASDPMPLFGFPNYNPIIPSNQFSLRFSLPFHLLFLYLVGFEGTTFSVGFSTNRARMAFAAAISPTAVHLGSVICLLLCFVRQTSTLPIPYLKTLQDVAVVSGLNSLQLA